LARKSGDISILQFDRRTISLLRVNVGPKRVTVRSFEQQRTPDGLENDAMGAALKTFAETHGLGSDVVYTVLPRHQVTTRIVELPSQDPGEIATMVRLNAEEYVPFSVDELIVDQDIIEVLPSGLSRVLVALVHRDVVHAHASVLTEAGIRAEQVFLSTPCLAAAAAEYGTSNDAPCAWADLSSAGLEVLVTVGGRLAYTRGVASEQDWSLTGPDAAEMQDELAVELRGSLSAYRRESDDGLGVDRVCVSSEYARVQPLLEQLAGETGKECVQADGADAFEGKTEALPLALLGAALLVRDEARLRIELLPEELRKGRELAGARRAAYRLAAMAVAVLIVCGIWFGQAVYQRLLYIQELERHVAVIEPSAKGIAEKREQLQILARQVGPEGNVLEVLAALAEVAPDQDLNINNFVYSRGRSIDFYGRARSVDDVYRYLADIRGLAEGPLSLLAQAKSMYENEGTERGEKIYNYRISIPINEQETGGGDE